MMNLKILQILFTSLILIVFSISCKHSTNPLEPENENINEEPVTVPTFIVTELTDNITLLSERHKNTKNSFYSNIIQLYGNQGNLIIDSGIKPLASKLNDKIEAINNSPLKYIINTHYHGDHIGGNSLLLTNDTLIFHEDGYIFYQRSNPDCQQLHITNQYEFTFNNEEILCYALPFDGHSAGDMLVLFPNSNILCVGDLYFSESFPYVDVSKGAKIDYLLSNFEVIESLINPETIIIPGHGAISSKEEFLNYIYMVMQTVSIVRQHLLNGKTESEIIALDVLKDYKKWEDKRMNTLTADYWIKTIINDFDLNHI